MIKALHVFKTYKPDSFGGIERVIFDIAEGLTPYGVESHVLSLSSHPEPADQAIGQHMGHRAKLDLDIASTGLSRQAVSRFRALSSEADIIHYHFPWPFMDALHLWVRPKAPALVTYHSDIVKQRLLMQPYRPLMNAFLSKVQRIVATSANYAATSPVLQSHQDKVDIIPIGLPPREAPDQNLISKWRARVGEGFFLFVGVPRYYKGLEFLMRAARQTGLPVVVATASPISPELQDSLPPNVTSLVGVSDPDKEALLELCKGFVFPSHLRSEAYGVSLVEAARAGKPMISCEIGTGTSYVNAADETGFVIPPADAEALAKAMTMLDQNPEQSGRFGEQARARFERHFRAADMADAYFKTYEALLAAK